MDDDELKKLLDRNAETIRGQFEATAERMEKRFDTLAEAVGRLDERLTSESNGIKKEVTEGFSETRAMIKFSHSDLDRRLRSLEAAESAREGRPVRLESKTH